MYSKLPLLKRGRHLRSRLLNIKTAPGRFAAPVIRTAVLATQTVLTPDQVKQRFKQRGETVSQWAEEHGFRRNAVYRVLNGFDKANYGTAHEIAVALGLKASAPESVAA